MVEFSVIIPNYNHAPFLKERIDSVLNQSYQNFEIILLDDHSTDNSKEILESYRNHPRVTHVFFSEKNSGSPFGLWGKGMQLAKHKWIWIAESDDVALPDFLKAAAGTIEHQQEAIIWYCNSAVEANNPETTTASINNQNFLSNTWNENYVKSAAEELNQHLKYRPVILNTSSAVFRKELFGNITAQLERFRYYGDWYAHISMIKDGVVLFDNRLLNRFRRTTQSHSLRMDKKSRMNIKVECFQILVSLENNKLVTGKKQLRRWFTERYIGFGFRSDGIGFVAKLVLRYYSINFILATKVLLLSLFQRLKKREKK